MQAGLRQKRHRFRRSHSGALVIDSRASTSISDFYTSASALLYHGDCNCDGFFNGADIGPFFDLVGGGMPCGFNFWGPEYVAWLIEAHVRPERLDRAIALIDDYTRGEARPDRRRFWNAVLDIVAPS